MQLHRFSVLLAVVPAMALGGCLGRGPQYAQYPYQYAQPPAAQPAARGYSAQASAGYAPAAAPYQAPLPPASYQAPLPAASYQAPAAQPNPTVITAAPAPKPQARGFFGNGSASFARAPAPVYRPPALACGPQGCGAPTASAYAAYPPPAFESPYLLDAGDRLRITVFGQEGLTNSYAVDAAGNVTLPLVGMIPARGVTTEQLSYSLSDRLRQGYIREPKVAIEVEAYRPFFIHGEVGTPGQYAYVANMTVENAIAIAGGFGPRADRSKVTLTRTIGGQTTRATVGTTFPLRPGDTLSVGERWF